MLTQQGYLGNNWSNPANFAQNRVEEKQRIDTKQEFETWDTTHT